MITPKRLTTAEVKRPAGSSLPRRKDLLAMVLIAFSGVLCGCGPHDGVFGVTQGISVAVPPLEGLEPGAAAIGATVPLSGRFLYEDVEIDENFVAQTATLPVRVADVVLLNPDTDAEIQTQTVSTAEDGSFLVSAPRNTPFVIGLKASTSASNGRANLEVRDSEASDAVYIYTFVNAQSQGPFIFDDLDLGATLPDILITRTFGVEPGSAVFNILDAGLRASDRAAQISGRAPSLCVFYWQDGVPLGSFFDPAGTPVGGPAIFVLGGIPANALSDTDEFDEDVLAHEYGHFFAFDSSRDSSLGGGHMISDRLYSTLAYGEGFADYYSCLNQSDPNYVDSTGVFSATPGGFTINFENDVPERRDSDLTGPVDTGFDVELSVAATFWDLSDGTEGRADADGLTAGLTQAQVFAPFLGLRNQQVYVDFLDYLELLSASLGGGGFSPAINAILLFQGIVPQVLPDSDPPSRTLPFGAGLFNEFPGTCQTRTEGDGIVDGIKRSNSFFKFSVPIATTPTVTVAMEVDNGTGADGDGTNLDLFVLDINNNFAVDRVTNNPLTPLTSGRRPTTTVESGSAQLNPGTYVIYVSGRSQDVATSLLTNAASVDVTFRVTLSSL